MLTGITRSRLNRPVAADEAFEKAHQLDPNWYKPLYNFAIHLYSFGRKVDALRRLEQAATLNPHHPGIRELRDRIEGKQSTGPRSMAPPPVSHTAPVTAPVQRIPIVVKMGIGWPILLALVALANLLAFVMFIALFARSDGNAAVDLSLGLLWGLSTFGMFLLSLMDTTDKGRSVGWFFALTIASGMAFGWLLYPVYVATSKR